MQTTQNNILSFDASIQGGVKKQNAQKQKQDKSEDGGEFLSMVLNAAAKKEGGVTEKDIKDIASFRKRTQSYRRKRNFRRRSGGEFIRKRNVYAASTNPRNVKRRR